MNKPNFTKSPNIPMTSIQGYERYLPSAFDESLSILQKMNKVIYQLNNIGIISNDLINKWNELIEWILGNGLNDLVSEEIDKRIADGTFDNLFDSLLGSLESLETIDKTSIVNAINEINAIALTNKNNIGEMIELETNDKTTLVKAINEVKYQSNLNEQAPIMIGESTGFGVISGFKVSQQSVLSMGVDIGNTAIENIIHMPNGNRFIVDKISLPVEPSHPSLNRLDLFYVSVDGKISYLSGVPSTNPTKPELPVGAVPLALITVVANDTSINNNDITDLRPLKALSFLETDYKDNFVGAINELIQDIENTKNYFETIIGNIDNANTVNKANVISIINEIIENVGDLDLLDVIDKTSIVNAINRLKIDLENSDEILSESITGVNELVSDINTLIGNMSDVNAEIVSQTIIGVINKSYDNLTTNINSVITTIGNLTLLTTDDKSSVVNAINDVITKINELNTNIDETISLELQQISEMIGNLTDLETTDKTSIVDAINELVTVKLTIDDFNTEITPIINRINDISINVKDFGAIADGLTDNATAFQNAINQVHTKGGGIVYVPSGTYLFANSVEIKSGVSLIGSGTNSSILKLKNSVANNLDPDNGSLWFFSRNATNVRVEHLTFDGNSSVQPKAYRALAFLSTVGAYVNNCHFYRCHGTDLAILSTENFQINKTQHYQTTGIDSNPGEGLYLYNARNGTVSDVIGMDLGDHLVYIDGVTDSSNDVIFSNMMAIRVGVNEIAGGSAYNIVGNSRNLVFNNCHSYDSAAGFRIAEQANFTPWNISLNNCSTNRTRRSADGHGITILTGKPEPVDVNVSINNCRVQQSGSGAIGSTAYGVIFQSVKNIKINNLDVMESNNDGVYFISCRDIYWVGGKLTDNGKSVNAISRCAVRIGDGDPSTASHNISISDLFTSDTGTTTKTQTYGFFVRSGATNVVISGGMHKGNQNGAWVMDGNVSPTCQFNGCAPNGDTRAMHYGNDRPNYGQWGQGTIIWNLNPSVGTPVGWVCTQSGEPGAWFAFGMITE